MGQTLRSSFGRVLAAIAFLATLHVAAGDVKIPDFLEQKKPKAKIMILGTFHFKDAGLDSYRPKYDVNILSEQRQREVREVIDLLAGYKPTKVAVEWTAEYQEQTDEQYRQYRAGAFELKANEVYQLGFRLAKRLGHPRVYLVDAKGRWFENRTNAEDYAAKHGQQAFLESKWYQRYLKLSEYADELKMKITLRDYFLTRNSEEVIRASHGVYLIGSFKVGTGDDYPGVDGFVSQWYNRNLKIFANLQRITESPNERILLIIGAGHVPIIRHAVEASPEYDLVEVHEALRP